MHVEPDAAGADMHVVAGVDEQIGGRIGRMAAVVEGKGQYVRGPLDVDVAVG